MSSFDPFGKDSLLFALIVGLVIIVLALLIGEKAFYWVVLVVALLVVLVGVLNFMKDQKDMLPLLTIIVGVVATVLWVYKMHDFGIF